MEFIALLDDLDENVLRAVAPRGAEALVACVRRGRLKLYPVPMLEQWLEDNAERLLDERWAA